MARFLRSVRPLSSVVSSSSSSLSISVSVSTARTVRCLSKMRLNHVENLVYGDGEKRQMVAVKAAVAATATVETAKTRVWDLPSNWLANVIDALAIAILVPLKTAARKKLRKSHIQMLVEKIIIDCRFFTLFGVSGSLLGSILCYLKGSFIVVESYFQYFKTLSKSHGSDQGHTVELLIEAIDMFLVGTALVVFGVGLYAMFVGSKTIKQKTPSLSRSNFFGLFYMKKIPSWVEMGSVSAAKSKIGHAMMMILQVGVLEKFNSVPLVSAADLACFAGAVLISSASIFFLSRLNVPNGAPRN